MASTKKQSANRSKPTKSRPAASSEITQHNIHDLSPILSSFSPDGSLFALITLAFDKHRLRIYNTVSNRAVTEYTVHSARVTTLSWASSRSLSENANLESASPEKKRRKKRTGQSTEEQTNFEDLVILGLSDGAICFFSPSHANLLQTLSHSSSSSPISSTSFDHRTPSHLWTSSEDSVIRLWDVVSASILYQWKNPDRQSYSSIAVRSSGEGEGTDLLAAKHQIKLFSLEVLDQDLTSQKPQETSSFTGHASSIKFLQWSKSQPKPTHFFTSAENDRFIYLWTAPHDSSSHIKPTATISLDADARKTSLTGQTASDEHLAALSTSGKVTITPIPSQIPTLDRSNKAHTLLPRVTIGNAPGKGSSNTPIADVAFTSTEGGSIHIARLVKGVKPVFDIVRYLDDSDNYVQNIALPEVEDTADAAEGQILPSKRYTESSIAVASGGDLDQSLEGKGRSLDVEGALDVDLAELSLGQRLKAVDDINASPDSDDDDRPVNGKSKTPKKGLRGDVSSIPAHSLTRTLIQALHSSDTRLLEMCLAHTDSVLIQNTVQRLPPQLTVPLITACVERLGRGARAANMKGGGGGASSQRGMGLITWIKTVLAIHAGHLMAMPDLVARLSGLHSTLTARLNLYESLLSLNGRLDMVLSQIEMRSSKNPATLAVPTSKGKENTKNATQYYVEGESDGSDEENEDMQIEADGDSEDDGSVEDVELGGDSESDDDDLSRSEESEDLSQDEEEGNGFIDDEAEEDSEDDSGSE